MSRKGLDRLLARYPDAEVAYVENQAEEVIAARLATPSLADSPHTYPGPWTLADLFVDGELLRFAIWRNTGAVYRVGEDGAVEDDPILS